MASGAAVTEFRVLSFFFWVADLRFLGSSWDKKFNHYRQDHSVAHAWLQAGKNKLVDRAPCRALGKGYLVPPRGESSSPTVRAAFSEHRLTLTPIALRAA